MKPFPSRDAVDFAAALALGAAIGWSVVTVLRSRERTHARSPRLVPRRRNRASPSPFLRELRDEAGRLARSAGEELAQTALSRLGGALLGARSSGGQ